jgi:hypothetical protein
MAVLAAVLGRVAVPPRHPALRLAEAVEGDQAAQLVLWPAAPHAVGLAAADRIGQALA